MDGLRVLERAAVAPSDLCLDPAAPFRVTTAPRLSPARQAQVKAALLRGGWRECGDEDRASVAAAVMATLDAAAWDAFLDATLAARRGSGLTWNDAPWRAWARLIEAEAARRLPVAPPVDVDKRASQRSALLTILRERGPTGALNTELNTAVGFRYGARLKELRDAGYEVRTDQISAQVFRYALVSEPAPKQIAMEAA